MKSISFTIFLLCLYMGMSFAQTQNDTPYIHLSNTLQETFVATPTQATKEASFSQDYDYGIKTNILAAFLFPTVRALADPPIVPIHIAIEIALSDNFSTSPYALYQFSEGFFSLALGAEIRWYIPIGSISRGPFLAYGIDGGFENYNNSYDSNAPSLDNSDPYTRVNSTLTAGFQYVRNGFLIEGFSGIGIAATIGDGYISEIHSSITKAERGVSVFIPFGISLGYAFW